jgi:hypothetical protein
MHPLPIRQACDVGLKSVESHLATCAVIDLDPVAAGIVELPEKSPHRSIRQRVKSVKSQR